MLRGNPDAEVGGEVGMTQNLLFDDLEHRSKFFEFHDENPHVFKLWEEITFKAIKRGYKHIGAALIRELIRWESGITTTDPEYKMPNQWTPYYARLFMQKHPEYAGLFRTRTAHADEEM